MSQFIVVFWFLYDKRETFLYLLDKWMKLFLKIKVEESQAAAVTCRYKNPVTLYKV